MTLWDWFQTARGELLTAGAAGAAVSAVMEWEGVWPAARRLFVGILTAFWLGPVGVPFFEWALGQAAIPTESANSVGGFLMGIGGIVVIEIIMKALRIRRDNLSGGKNGDAPDGK